MRRPSRISTDLDALAFAAKLGCTAFAAICLALWFSRASIAQSTLVGIVLAANIAGFGALWRVLLRRPVGAPEGLAVGVAATFASQVILQFALGALPGDALPVVLRYLPWVLGPVALLVALWVIKPMSAPPEGAPWSWKEIASGLAAFTGALVLGRGQFANYPLGVLPPTGSAHPDMVVFQLMANGNSGGQLGQLGFMSNWPARYHWFSYAWSGQLEGAFGLTPGMGITRVVPVLAILGLAFAAIALVGLIRGGFLAALLAALLVTMGRLPADSTGLQVNWDSPSQGLGTVLVLGSLIVLLRAIEAPADKTVVRWAALAAAVFGFAAMGTKASGAIVLLAGCAGVCLLATMQRASWSRAAWTQFAAAAFGVAVSFLAVVSGSEIGMSIDPRWVGPASALTVFTGAVATTLAVIPGSFGTLVGPPRATGGATAARAFAIGSLIAGLAVLWTFKEAGPNTRWFLTTALAVAWIVSSSFAGTRLSALAKGSRRWALLAVIGASALSVGLWALIVDAGLTSHMQSEVLYLLLWSAMCVLLSGAAAVFGRHRVPILALLSATGVLSLLLTIPAERFLDVGPVPEAVDIGVGEAAAAPTSAVSQQVLQDAAVQLSREASPNDVVALQDDGLLQVLLLSRTVPYASIRGYVPRLGAPGSLAEFDRRSDVVRRALEAQSDELLCAEGVDWVVTAQQEKVLVRRTDCSR